MSSASIYEMLLALGRSVCQDADRQRHSDPFAAGFQLPKALLAPPSATAQAAQTPSAQQLLRTAYSVLLLGGGGTAIATASASQDIRDELHFVQFEISMRDPARASALGEAIGQLPEPDVIEPASAASDVHNVLQLLLQLRESCPVSCAPQKQASRFFPPAVSVHRQPLNCYTNVLHQYLGGAGDGPAKVRAPSFFDIQLMQEAANRSANPYLLQHSLLRNGRQTKAAQQKAAIAKVAAARHPPPQKRRPPTTAPDRIHLKSQSWDFVNVPLDRHRRELLFASESSAALPHILQQVAGAGSATGARMLRTADLLADVKYLLVGVPSESFRFDEQGIRFDAVNGVCVLNATPEATAASLAGFLECGTCCARLRMMCARDADFAYKFEGFVFRTVCQSVEEFLDIYQKFVVEFDDDSVLLLSNRMALMMRQIRQLAILFAIHPDVPPQPEPPTDSCSPTGHPAHPDHHPATTSTPLPCGPAFLNHLHREITNLTQPDVAILFTHILQQCCLVYYRQFELWLFAGRIEDASGELFIEFTPCPWPHSKHFWDRAFRVRPAAVPHFLRGTEQSTLLCGKYTMLLKAIRPQHPLLRQQPPRLSVCLADRQLAELHTECAAYGRRLRRVCGEPVAVRAVYAQMAARREECVRRATERFAENMARWRAEQADKRERVLEAQGRQREALQRQLSELHERKVTERRDRLAVEREVLRQAEELEEVRRGRERDERERRIEHYAELGQLVERRRAEAEAVVRDLRVQLRGAQEVTARMESCLVGVGKEGEGEEGEKAVAEDCNRNPVASSEPVAAIASGSDENANGQLAAISAGANRAHVLGSTFDFHHHSTAGAKATELLGAAAAASTAQDTISAATDANSNPVCALPLATTASQDATQQHSMAHTEMLQNRARIMGQEYDLIGFTDCGETGKVARASVADSQLTDLQRNRRKVLSEEFGYHPIMHLDLRRNDNHQQHKLELPEQPMSTSSDTPAKRFEDAIVEATASAAVKCPSLKLNVSATQPLPPASAITLNSSEMQTAATHQSDSADRFVFAAPNSDTSSVYESACSVGASHNLEAEDVARPVDHQHHDDPFQYPTSIPPLAPSEFFAIPWHQPPSQPQADTELTGSAQPADSPEADIAATLTGRLRSSYLLPLRTHLRVLSNEILKVFLLDFHALEHFKSLRNYFLMMDGEFAGHICDGLFARLQPPAPAQPRDILNFGCLHSLLDSAIACSSAASHDRHAERLSFAVDDVPDAFETRSPHVLRMLQLTYSVEWPLCLLLSADAIEHYARCFQHLLALRRCRYVLDEASQRLKAVAKGGGGGKGNNAAARSVQFGRVQQMRNKLLQFINGLQNHVTATALQGSWRRFRSELEAAESMEDCYQMHARYLKQVEFLCMLNRSSERFYRALESVMVLVLRFYHKLVRHEWHFDEAGRCTHPAYAALLAIEADFDKLMPYVCHMGEKISRRGYQTEIDDLINLINFNGFYK